MESLFYLYRLTKDPVYQDWGFQILQNFNKYTKVSKGELSTRTSTFWAGIHLLVSHLLSVLRSGFTWTCLPPGSVWWLHLHQ